MDVSKELIEKAISLLDQYEDVKRKHCVTPEEFIKGNYCDQNLFVDDGGENIVDIFFQTLRFRDFLRLLIEDVPLKLSNSLLAIVNVLIFRLTDSCVCELTDLILERLKPKNQSDLFKYFGKPDILSRMTILANKVYDIYYVQEVILRVFEPNLEIIRTIYSALKSHHITKKLQQTKPVTIPMEPSTLCRSIASKVKPTDDDDSITAVAPSTGDENTITNMSVTRRPLKADKIQKKLRAIKAKNKQKSEELLEITAKIQFTCANTNKSKKYYDRLERIKNEQSLKHKIVAINSQCSLTCPPPNIKKNATTILREGAHYTKKAVEAKKLYSKLEAGFVDPNYVKNMLQQIKEQERDASLQAIEKKHLQGLITREEMRLAKAELKRRRIDAANELKRESEEIERQLEEFKQIEMIKIRELVDKNAHLMHLTRLAQEELKYKKRENAKILMEESRQILEDNAAQKQKELEEKITIIRELKQMRQLIRDSWKESSINLDCVASSGTFLYELSLTELKDAIKKTRTEVIQQIEERRKAIKDEHMRQQKVLQDACETIEKHTRVSKVNRASNYKSAPSLKINQELLDLKQKLEAKRKQLAGL